MPPALTRLKTDVMTCSRYSSTNEKNTDDTKLLHWILFQKNLETEWFKGHTITNEMFAHSLDPMQAERMQHSAGTLHDTEHCNCEHEPAKEDDDHGDRPDDAGHEKCIPDRHVPQDNRESLMGEGKSPETEIRCRMRNTIETEF